MTPPQQIGLGRREVRLFPSGANPLCSFVLLQHLRRVFSRSEFVVVASRMVKVSFNSALGQKDVKKDAETLIPDEDKVSRKWLTEPRRRDPPRPAGSAGRHALSVIPQTRLAPLPGHLSSLSNGNTSLKVSAVYSRRFSGCCSRVSLRDSGCFLISCCYLSHI